MYRTGPRLGHDARDRLDRRRHQGPHPARRHRPPLPGQPRQPDAQDRRAGQHRPHPGHLRPARRDVVARRSPHRDRDPQGRRRPGRAQQPLQAHRAADQLQRQHAGTGRRRTSYVDARPVRQPLDQPPDRSHPAPHPVPPRRGRGPCAHLPRSGEGPRRPRRGHRPDPSQPDGRGSARRTHQAAQDRRAPGQRHPRDAAAPSCCPRAPEDHG